MEHVVLFKWGSTVTQEQKDAIGKAIINLGNEIDFVEDLSWGRTFTTNRADGYEHALVVRLPNKDSLEKYAQHPAHLHVVEHFIKPCIKQSLAMDFTSPRYTFSALSQDDANEEEEDKLRRSGSLPIPADLQPELMSHVTHLQNRKAELEDQVEILTFINTTILSGVVLAAGIAAYFHRHHF